MKKYIYTLATLILAFGVHGQMYTQTIFSDNDKLLLSPLENGKLYYNHKIVKGNTLYSLSKAFQVNPKDIYVENGLKQAESISLNQVIRIPIDQNRLYTGAIKPNSSTLYIAAIYIAQPKDNIFRIARIYFNQSIEGLMERNNLTNNNIALGQEIIIGWYPMHEKHIDLQNPKETDQELTTTNSTAIDETAIVAKSDSLMEEVIDTTINYPAGFDKLLLGDISYNEDINQVKRTDVAHWDKSIANNGMIYVLHDKAILDSYIEIYNPLLKRSTRAKVIGRIPYGTYSKKVHLILSPQAAHQLGALDKRFKVEVKYLERV